MDIAEALRLAREWVLERAEDVLGAYVSGSLAERDALEEMPADSDIDIVLITADEPRTKPGKESYRGLIIEPTLIPERCFRDMEHIQSTHYLAWGLQGRRILYDPSGWLTRLSEQVCSGYFSEESLRARVRSVTDLARRHAGGTENAVLPEDILMGVMFSAGCTMYPVLAAAGRNCTVRKRLTAVRAVLEGTEREGMLVRFEAVLGANGRTSAELMPHMNTLETLFSEAALTCGASETLPYRGDIREDARRIALDGTRTLLEGAHPADAVFWLAVTFARCMKILHADLPERYEAYLPALHFLMELLGIASPETVRERIRLIGEVLSESVKAAEEMIRSRG